MERDKRVEVQNAADPRQVKRAGARGKQRERETMGAYLDVMRTPSGRRVLWDLLERCKVFESIWHPSALIHYNAGRQDVGHELLSVLAKIDTKSYLEMEREARLRDAQDDSEREAFHTRADEGAHE